MLETTYLLMTKGGEIMNEPSMKMVDGVTNGIRIYKVASPKFDDSEYGKTLKAQLEKMQFDARPKVICNESKAM